MDKEIRIKLHNGQIYLPAGIEGLLLETEIKAPATPIVHKQYEVVFSKLTTVSSVRKLLELLLQGQPISLPESVDVSKLPYLRPKS